VTPPQDGNGADSQRVSLTELADQYRKKKMTDRKCLQAKRAGGARKEGWEWYREAVTLNEAPRGEEKGPSLLEEER